MKVSCLSRNDNDDYLFTSCYDGKLCTIFKSIRFVADIVTFFLKDVLHGEFLLVISRFDMYAT